MESKRKVKKRLIALYATNIELAKLEVIMEREKRISYSDLFRFWINDSFEKILSSKVSNETRQKINKILEMNQD